MDLTPEAIQNLIESGVPFVKRMGLKAIDLQPRRVKFMAPLDVNHNHIGSVYAGALFTLAEIPGGALFLTTFDWTKYYPLVKEMTIRFLKPARTDVTFELSLSESEVERIEQDIKDSGKAEFVLEGEILDLSGQVVARTSGLYQIRALAT